MTHENFNIQKLSDKILYVSFYCFVLHQSSIRRFLNNVLSLFISLRYSFWLKILAKLFSSFTCSPQRTLRHHSLCGIACWRLFWCSVVIGFSRKENRWKWEMMRSLSVPHVLSFVHGVSTPTAGARHQDASVMKGQRLFFNVYWTLLSILWRIW